MRLTCETCQVAEASLVCLPGGTPACGQCASQQRSTGGQKMERVAVYEPEQVQRCYICQDAPAMCFCLDERALLCRDCDVSIHKANKFNEGHARFLFTGLRVGLQDMSSSYSGQGAGKRKASAVSPLQNTGKQPALGSSPLMMSGSSSAASTSSAVSHLAASTSSMLQASSSLADGGHMVKQVSVGAFASPYDAGPPGSTAADFLGVPSISESFSIKDVDAAYMADEFGSYGPSSGLSEDVTHLLEVPDLDFGDIGGFGGPPDGGPGNNSHWLDDGVVPDIRY